MLNKLKIRIMNKFIEKHPNIYVIIICQIVALISTSFGILVYKENNVDINICTAYLISSILSLLISLMAIFITLWKD